jgi:hypothetical protein
MRIEIFENIQKENRTECRTYEIRDGMVHILTEKGRFPSEVWGFDKDGYQYEGKLIEIEPHVVLTG